MDSIRRHVPARDRMSEIRPLFRLLLLQQTTCKTKFPHDPRGTLSLLLVVVVVTALLVSVTNAHITDNSRVDQMDYTILPAINTTSPYEVTLVIVSEQGIKHAAYVSLGKLGNVFSSK